MPHLEPAVVVVDFWMVSGRHSHDLRAEFKHMTQIKRLAAAYFQAVTSNLFNKIGAFGRGVW